MTNDIIRRVREHKEEHNDGFTKKYQVKTLVYYLQFEDVTEAIYYEKRLKNWKRKWKLELIEKHNSSWKDLYCNFFDPLDAESSSA